MIQPWLSKHRRKYSNTTMILRLWPIGTWQPLFYISKQHIIYWHYAGSAIPSAKQRFNLSGFESRVDPGIGPVLDLPFGNHLISFNLYQNDYINMDENPLWSSINGVVFFWTMMYKSSGNPTYCCEKYGLSEDDLPNWNGQWELEDPKMEILYHIRLFLFHSYEATRKYHAQVFSQYLRGKTEKLTTFAPSKSSGKEAHEA